MTVAGVGSRAATENLGERVGPTDEEILRFGMLLRQRRGSRPFAAIRKACVRPPCGSKPTDTRRSTADARTKSKSGSMSSLMTGMMAIHLDHTFEPLRLWKLTPA